MTRTFATLHTLIVLFSMVSAVVTAASLPPLETVTHVDLNRYMGQWYEIARLPMHRQKDCIRSEAFYSKDEKGKITVKNRCSLVNGTHKEVTGTTYVEDKNSFAKLKVNFVPIWFRFLGIGWSNYWIIDLSPDYHYAVVSEPKREYLWILSRSPNMAKSTYDAIIARLRNKGFDTNKLIISGDIDFN